MDVQADAHVSPSQRANCPRFVQTAMHTSATFRLRAKLRARANGLEEVMRTSGADTGMVHQNQMSAVPERRLLRRPRCVQM